MKMRWWLVLVAVGVSAAVAPLRAEGTLRSPWDARAVKVVDGKYDCSVPKGLPKDITLNDYYSDAKHSVIDEARYKAYRAAADEFDDATKVAAKAADYFQATGKRPAAECVLQILDTQAASEAMTGVMSSGQAQYVQGWTLGAFAAAWLKVRAADPGIPEQRHAATAWMDKVGRQVQVWFSARHTRTPPTKDATNNHYYWAGFAAAGAAIGADDHALYDWGMGTFDDGVSRIMPDGTLPLEMDRAARALHYHLFAITPLVMLAEYGEANGRVMYAREHGALARLARASYEGLKNNSYFEKKAGAKQDTPGPDGLKSNEVAWMAPWLKRFPDAGMQRMLDGVKVVPYNYIGGLPPGVQ